MDAVLAKARIFLRRPSVILACLVVAGIALAVTLFHQPKPHARNHAGAEALIDRFEKVAFRDDITPETKPELFRDHLTRWEYPIRLRFLNVDRVVQDHAASFMTEVQSLVGRRVWIVPSSSVTPPNVIVTILSLKYFEKRYGKIHENHAISRNIAMYTCFIDLSESRNKYYPKINIFINYYFGRKYFLNCVLEEIVQGLGLLGDTMQNFDSLFVEDREVRLDFPLNDKILLRTLYDPRLRDGMPRAQAMVRVRAIIPELLAAYEAEGLQGLYQPLRDPSW